MKNEKKYKGVFTYETKEGIMYQVNTTMLTKDGYKKQVCKKGFKTPKQACDWKEQERVRYSEHNLIEIESGKSGFDAGLDKYLEHKKHNCKGNSLNRFKDRLDRFFMPYVKDMKTEDLGISHLETIYKNLADKDLSISTKNIVISTIINFLEYLDLTECLSPNIIKKAKLIFIRFNGTGESKAHYIEHEDFKELLESYSGEDIDDMRMRLVLNLLMYTGARAGEILGLHFDDLKIDFTDNEDECYVLTFNKQSARPNEFNIEEKMLCKFKNAIILPYTKTYSIKTIVIPNWLGEDILEYKDKTISRTGYMFEIERNTLMTRAALYFRISTRAEELGIEHFRVHDFRGTHITDLYEMGASGKYVQARAGHNNELTSRNVYQTISDKRKAKNDEMMKNFKI